MNMPITLRRHPRSHAQSVWSWRSLPWLACAAVAAWALHVFTQSAPAALQSDVASATVPSVVHWQDAGHDWLLVVDQLTHELVVYDAVSGQPLRRFGGVAKPIDGIAGEGDLLIATSHQDPRVQVLSLPDLRPAMLVSR